VYRAGPLNQPNEGQESQAGPETPECTIDVERRGPSRWEVGRNMTWSQWQAHVMKTSSSLVGIALCLAASAHAGPPATWRSVGLGGGGALFAPSWSPFSSSEIYLARDMSEQFQSTDTGASWRVTPFTRLQVGGNSPKVQVTSDPLILYMIDSRTEGQPPFSERDTRQ